MIVVFGSINLDLTARVERFPKPGETIIGTAFAAVPGGKGANQALAARRAGAQVAMVGAVGTDAFAPTSLAGLVDAGVDTGWVTRVDAPTRHRDDPRRRPRPEFDHRDPRRQRRVASPR